GWATGGRASAAGGSVPPLALLRYWTTIEEKFGHSAIAGLPPAIGTPLMRSVGCRFGGSRRSMTMLSSLSQERIRRVAAGGVSTHAQMPSVSIAVGAEKMASTYSLVPTPAAVSNP